MELHCADLRTALHTLLGDRCRPTVALPTGAHRQVRNLVRHLLQQALQFGQDGGEAGRPGLRVLLHTGLDEPRQRRRAVGPELAQRHRLLMHDLVEDARKGLALEGLRLRYQLVGQHPEGEDVGALVELLTLHLLGREIGGSSDRGAGLSEPALLMQQLGHPEVHDLGRAVLEDPDVGRLDVAMHDPLAVGVLEAARDLEQVEQHAPQGERLPALDLAVQILAGQELLDQIRSLVLDPEVVDGGDVAVVEIAGDLRLAGEAEAHALLRRAAGLDRQVPLDDRIVALEDLPEPPDPDLLDHLILAEGLHERAGPMLPPRARHQTPANCPAAPSPDARSALLG